MNPRRGNIDFVLFETPLELNYAYGDTGKIAIDFCKLLDDENGFAEAAYLAFSHRSGFRHAVERGFEQSLDFLMRRHGVMCLSHSLDVVVVEDCRTLTNRGALSAWEANVQLLRNGTLDWHLVA